MPRGDSSPERGIATRDALPASAVAPCEPYGKETLMSLSNVSAGQRASPCTVLFYHPANGAGAPGRVN